ncbi:MAG: hypothetical protein D6681_20965 [Calditrichaeota bacterium]|nr:MAG: hypothetical protein D6681_20965 [Calditrichota bacterium]
MVGLVLLFLPDLAAACDKCFGAGVDTPTTRGIGMAMLALLILTTMIFGGIIGFFVHMNRRARLLASGNYVINEQGVLLALPSRIMES